MAKTRKSAETTFRRVGFKRSYLRRSFWRANASILMIVGTLVVLVVIMGVKRLLN